METSTEISNKKVIHTIIDQNRSERVAIESVKGRITYSELSTYSNRLANGIDAMKVPVQEVVGTYLPSSAAYVVSLLATFKSGGICMPMEPSHPKARLADQLKQARPNICITTKDELAGLLGVLVEAELSPEIIIIDESLWKFYQIESAKGTSNRYISMNAPKEKIAPKVNGESSAYLMYTSGSTGVPKAVEGVHQGLSHFIHWEASTFNLSQEVRVSQLAPLSFDVSLRDIFLPLLLGGTLCIPPPNTKKAISSLLSWLEESKINLVHTVPSLLRSLSDQIASEGRRNYLTSLEYIFLAGEALYGKDVRNWKSIVGSKAQLVNLYGPSETTLAKLFYKIGDTSFDDGEIIPLGVPISNTAALVVKGTELCGIDELGEILIKTPFRSNGYFQNPELTAKKFVQNPLHAEFEDIVYKTGDLGKYMADGTIAFVGRTDNQVKIRGNRVELSEVEQEIIGYPGVKQAVVIPWEKANKELALVAYIGSEIELDEKDLLAYLKGHLPIYMLPGHIVRLDEFPTNLNGKVNRKALPKPEALLYDQMEFVPPSSKTETTLAAIWKQALGLQKVGVTNDFFQLGGHSLNATQVIAYIYKDFGKQVSLKELFQHTTVRALAKLLDSKNAHGYSKITKAPQQDHYPLSAAQHHFWLMHQLDPESAAYHMPMAMYLEGDLDIEKLKDCFEQLVRRYEILRTRIVIEDEVPMQKVETLEHLPASFQHIDFRKSSYELKDLHDAVTKVIAAPFNLTKGPLFRGTLIETHQNYVFVLNAHHLISDGWSMRLIVEQLLVLYKAKDSMNATMLPALSIQYKDYAYWKNMTRNDMAMRAAKNYWESKLASPSPKLKFPFKKPETSNTLNRVGALYKTQIDLLDYEALESYAKEKQVTFFSLVTALVKVLSYAYTGNEDIRFGTPVSGREHAQLEDQIGLFLNVVVLRSKFDREMTFENFLAQVQQTILEGYEHQNYPIEQLAANLDFVGAKQESSLYDVLIVLNTEETGKTTEAFFEQASFANEIENLTIAPFPIVHNTSKLDLSFFFSQSDTLHLELEYRQDALSNTAIEQIGEDFKQLVKGLLKTENPTIESLASVFYDTEELETAKGREDALTQVFDEDF